MTKKIVKIICYSFDSCEKLAANKFDYITIYMEITDQIIMISSRRFKNHEAYSKWIYFFSIILIYGLTENVQ